MTSGFLGAAETWAVLSSFGGPTLLGSFGGWRDPAGCGAFQGSSSLL